MNQASRGQNRYELVGETITGAQTSAKTEDKESMRIMLPGMQASNDVKSFRVFQTGTGTVRPDHFELSQAFFTKWK